MAPHFTKEDENLLFIIRKATVELGVGKWTHTEAIFNHFATCPRTWDGLKSKYNTMARGRGSTRMEKRTNNDVWNKKKEEVKQLLEGKSPPNEPCPEAESRSIVSPTPVRLHSSLLTEWEGAVQDDPAIDPAASPWLGECWHLDSIGASNPAAHGAMFSALRYTADPFLDATMDPFKNTSMIGLNNTAGNMFDGTAMNPLSNTGWTTLDTTAMCDFGNVDMATFDNRVPGTIGAAQMDPIVWNAMDTFVNHETQHFSDISDMDADLMAVTDTLTQDSALAWVSPSFVFS